MQTVALSQKALAKPEDPVAPPRARMVKRPQHVRSTLPGTPASGRQYPDVDRAQESSFKKRRRKERTLAESSSPTDGGDNPVTSTEDRKGAKKEHSVPTRATKLQKLRVDTGIAHADAKDKGPTKRLRTKAGTHHDAARTEEISKHLKDANSIENDSASAELDTLFLAHTEKARRTGKYLGAHISAAGGAQNAPVNCLNVGDPAKRQISYAAFVDDLSRCEQLGIKRYVFHPGSTVGDCAKSEGIKNVAFCLNEAIAMTQYVTILLENMSGQKNMLCSSFEDLRDIIQQVKRKDRVGVCLDTCHLFAAGFDIRTPDGFETVIKKFDAIVGLEYLKGMHINDSKSDIASGLDRHEHLGKGFIGMAAFKFIMQHPRWFKNMPLIIETPEKEGNPAAIWRDEIKKLYEFVEP